VTFSFFFGCQFKCKARGSFDFFRRDGSAFVDVFQLEHDEREALLKQLAVKKTRQHGEQQRGQVGLAKRNVFSISFDKYFKRMSLNSCLVTSKCPVKMAQLDKMKLFYLHDS